MRLKLVLALSLLITFKGFAQDQSAVDSLKNVVAAAPLDTLKIDAALILGELFINQDPDSSMAYYRISEHLANELLSSGISGVELRTARKNLATAYNGIASNLDSRGEIQDALEYYTRSLEINQEIGERSGEAEVYNNLGFTHYNLGNIDKAMDYFTRAIGLYEELGRKYKMAITLNNIGVIYDTRGDPGEALKHYSKGLEINKETGNKRGMAYSYHLMGTLHHRQGNLDLALEYLTLSLDLRQEIGDKTGLAFSLHYLGDFYYSKGELLTALDYSNRCLHTWQELGNKQGMATTLDKIGTLYYILGDPVRGKNYCMRSIKMHEEIGGKSGLALATYNLGVILNEQGEITAGLENLISSLEIWEVLGSIDNVARCLSALGVINKIQGNYSQAYQYYTRALGIAIELDSQYLISSIYKSLGSMYRAQADTELAMDFYEKSLYLSEGMGNKLEMASTYSSIGALFVERGEYEFAYEYHKKSLDIREEIAYKRGIAQSSLHLGNLARIMVNDTMFSNFATKAYRISKELGFPRDIGNAAYMMKDLSIMHHDFPLADTFALENITIINEAIFSNFEILSEPAQEKYFATVAEDYMEFNSYALTRREDNPGIADHVFNNTLKNKGLLLKSSTAMRTAVLNSGDSALIIQYYNWISLKKQLADLYSKGQYAGDLEERVDVLERDLVKGSGDFSDFKEMQALSWKDVQDALGQDEAAIEFIHFKYRDRFRWTDSILYCALILKKDSAHPAMVAMFEQNQLEEILQGTGTGGYVDNVYGTRSNFRGELYELIWKPLELELEGIERIYISPSGLLHKVSFAAIARERNVVLSDVYDININSSSGKITSPSKFSLDNYSTTALFGGIVYNSDSTEVELWNYLEGTRSEVERIGKIFQRNRINVDYLTDTRATEESFKLTASTNNLLHISTHGFFFPDPQETRKDTSFVPLKEEIVFRGGNRGFGYPVFIENLNPLMRSGLVFASANDVWSRVEQPDREDGILTAQEVAHTDMRSTGLVVMSACETGLGDIRGSEGVYGLQRAFKMAGVKFLIMSLWQVPDRETEEFMVAFYKNLIDLDDIRQAFSTTQESMRRKYDPFYWAAFVLIE